MNHELLRELLLNSRRKALSGVEFDWLLVDGRGCVALCCSFVDGEIPDAVLKIEERHRDQLQDAVSVLSEQMPVLGSFHEESGGMGSDLVSPEFARRGICSSTGRNGAVLLVGCSCRRFRSDSPRLLRSWAPSLVTSRRRMSRSLILLTSTCRICCLAGRLPDGIHAAGVRWRGEPP